MKMDISQLTKPCSCGQTHQIFVKELVIKSGAISRLPEVLARPDYRDSKQIVMICDANTFEVAGRQVKALVPAVKAVVLPPENLHADEHGVALARDGIDRAPGADLMIAVGSGTVHDITRYHAYQMGIPFISVPTAASVDGFVSTVAAMTWKGCKKSFTAVSPEVVLADTDIFKTAPLRLTASGVSDLLGKYTALADWKIAHRVTGEPICETICQMEYDALDALKASLPGLKSGDTEAYEALMYGLLLSGLAMQMTGNSRPASGAEHHMSHLWEMGVINAPIDFYHGEKVGVGLVLASKIYHRAAEYLRSGRFAVAKAVPLEEALIRESFTRPDMLDEIMAENTSSLLDAVDPAKLRANAAAIADIVEAIPKPEEIIAMIDAVGGVKSLADLGFDDSYQAKTARLSPYVRNRLTLMRLLKFFDFYEDALAAK